MSFLMILKRSLRGFCMVEMIPYSSQLVFMISRCHCFQSTVRRVAIQTGEIMTFHKMESSYFGEGLTLLGERLYQVTWLKKIGFIYDRNDFSKFKRFTHQMEDGWGLATDGKYLYGTDGSSTLYHIDPQNMKVIQKQVVTYNGHEVHNLNELEYIDDEVWANVWQTDCIAKISPKDGIVREWILLQSLREGLLASGRKNFDVLNGIAWDKEKNRIFGKLLIILLYSNIYWIMVI
ncbi:hypothetical protein AgCh_014746 [Apium graveolens]